MVMLDHSSWKFSPFMSNNAAEPISPTTTGRSPAKIPLIIALSLWRWMNLLVKSTKKKEGRTTAIVAIIAPHTVFPVAV